MDTPVAGSRRRSVNTDPGYAARGLIERGPLTSVSRDPAKAAHARATAASVKLREGPGGGLVAHVNAHLTASGHGRSRRRVFDITRPRGSDKPLTFGAEIHYCLSANLAGAELQAALAFLAPRMLGLALDGEPELGAINGIYGVERLPLSFSPSA